MLQTEAVLLVLKTMAPGLRNADISQFNRDQLKQVMYTGLGPVLCFCSDLKKFPPTREVETLLTGAKQMARVLTGNQLDFIQQLLLDEEQRDSIVLLKGSATALLYYPDPTIRIMGDVDLLVEPAGHQPLEDFCINAGFVKKSIYPEHFYRDFHHSMPLFNEATKVWVEIHTGLFNTDSPAAGDSVFNPENVIREVSEFSRDGKTFKSLNKEIMLLYICTHWAAECHWQKTPIRLLDVLLLLHDKSVSVDWKKIIAWLTTSPVSATCLAVVLGFFIKHDLAKIPEAVIMAVQQNTRNINKVSLRVLHRLIEKYAIEGREHAGVWSEANINIIWSTLLFGSMSPWGNLLVLLPKNIILPPKSENRFSLRFQFSRMKNLFIGR